MPGVHRCHTNHKTPFHCLLHCQARVKSNNKWVKIHHMLESIKILLQLRISCFQDYWGWHWVTCKSQLVYPTIKVPFYFFNDYSIFLGTVWDCTDLGKLWSATPLHFFRIPLPWLWRLHIHDTVMPGILCFNILMASLTCSWYNKVSFTLKNLLYQSQLIQDTVCHLHKHWFDDSQYLQIDKHHSKHFHHILYWDLLE